MQSQYRKLLVVRGAETIADKTQVNRLPEGWERECSDYGHLEMTRLGDQMKCMLRDIQDKGIEYGEV